MTTSTPYTITLNDDHSEAEIIFPHFDYSAYSGTGLANPWFITKCFEAGRYISLSHGFSDGQELIIRGGMYVVMICDYHIHWEAFANVDRLNYFPYKVKVTLQRVGNSSLVWRHELVNTMDNKVLATLTAKVVHLNRMLRRSEAFPMWFLDKFKHLRNNETGIRSVAVPPPPPTSFWLTQTVMLSSVDVNGHLNNSAFVRLALDCVATACLKDHFRNIKGDIRKMWLTDLFVHYHKEGLFDDEIRVACWEGSKPGQVYCILKRGETTIASFSMNFVQPVTTRL